MRKFLTLCLGLSVSASACAQSTTAIEGNTLTEEEIQKVIDKQKLPESKAYQEIEVQNVLDAMNEIGDSLFYKDGGSKLIREI